MRNIRIKKYGKKRSSPTIIFFVMLVLGFGIFSGIDVYHKRKQEKTITEKIDILASAKSNKKIIFDVPLFCFDGKTYAKHKEKWLPITIATRNRYTILECGERDG